MIARLLLLVLAFAAPAARAEQLLLSLSAERISITSNFTGADLALFGAIERDGATVARASTYDVVVNVRGPRGSVVVREKSAIGPFWLNADQRRYIAIPAFIATLSNRPLPQIAGDLMLQKLTLGVDALVPPQGRRTDIFDPDEPNFRQALMRLRRAEGLFVENGQAVTFLSQNAFRAAIRIPGTAPLGRYDVDVTLLADGVPLTRDSIAFTVIKGGVEQRLATASRERGVLYGLATALMALSLGWLATVIFRRD
ncbi:MAG: TIGR02186 family protein [Methylobacteriaceae bacterium]|nr:TIGR02186 family protein [Methylobacteriaceae bacterium]